MPISFRAALTFKVSSKFQIFPELRFTRQPFRLIQIMEPEVWHLLCSIAFIKRFRNVWGMKKVS